MHKKAKKLKVPPPSLGYPGKYVERYLQHQNYLCHRKYVMNALPQIDNKAPILYPQLYIRFKQFHDTNEKAMQIQRENKHLLYKINKINRTKGSVNSFWKKYPVHISSTYFVRKNEAEQVTKENCVIHRRIKNTNPVYCRDKHKEEWKRNEKLLMQVSIYKNKITTVKNIAADIGIRKNQLMTRPYRCFFDMEAEGGEQLGRLIFEIYSDIVPKTAFNFLAICKGNLGLSYKGCVFHRITPGLLCQGGDITKGNGSGGVSVYGYHFPDENFTLRHGGAGVLSMANFGKATNSSIFNITFRPLSSLNGVCVVIGRVVESSLVLFEIQKYGTATGKPRKKVFIADCGLLYQ